MNNRTVHAHQGVGDIRFGMSAGQIAALLGQPDSTQGPDEFSDVTREHFREHCLFVDYNRSGQCLAVELYGYRPVELNGHNLMVKNYKDLVTHLQSEGISLVEKDDGFRCDTLGVAAYAPQLEDPEVAEAPIESVLVYAHGYYDELDAKLTN